MNQNFKEIMGKAREFYRQKDYQQALDSFEKTWKEKKEIFFPDDLYNFCVCLRKEKRIGEAIPTCVELVKIEPQTTRFKNLLGWMYYDDLFQEKKYSSEQDFLQKAEEITALTCFEESSPYELTVMKTLEWLRGKTSIPSSVTKLWLQKVEPSLLSVKPFKIEIDPGKEVRKPSHLEVWYATHTSLLLKEGGFQNCIEACEKALEEIQKQIPDGETFWLYWRKALCLEKTGKYEDALSVLFSIRQKQKDWFFHFEIAQIYSKIKNYELALKHALKAALFPTSMTNKVEVYLFLADLFAISHQTEMERKNLWLYILTKNKEDWCNVQVIQDKLHSFGYPSTLTSTQLYRELKTLWAMLLRKMLLPENGHIQKVFGGKKGFIRNEKGKEYFFTIDQFQALPLLLKEGLKVTIYIDPEEIEKCGKATEAYLVYP